MLATSAEVNGNVSRLSPAVAAKFVKLRIIIAPIQAQSGSASGAVPKDVLTDMKDAFSCKRARVQEYWLCAATRRFHHCECIALDVLFYEVGVPFHCLCDWMGRLTA